MTHDREQLLKHYTDARDMLRQAIDGLTDEQMSEPTIDGWSVKDHLAHVAAWDDLRAAEVERIAAGFDSAWKMTDEQDDAFNDAAYDLRRSISASQARWEFETATRKLLDAIASAPPAALDPELYGSAGIGGDHDSQHAGWIARWRRERGY